MAMLYSFDVFDTLITRKTATPRGIFALMQQQLTQKKKYAGISRYVRENFYSLRIHSEELARFHFQKNGIEDVTLEQIYESMMTTGMLALEDCCQLAALERETECGNVLGIKKNIDLVCSYTAEGRTVVLISDMYLDAVTIRQMLVKIHPCFEHLQLYVSSEYKKGKYTGNLYRKVQEVLHADFSQWKHMGDNLHSDVAVPKELGIQTVSLEPVDLLPIEREYMASNESDGYVQYILGAAKNARLMDGLVKTSSIGCTAAGPILVPYVQWILQESIRRGIHRLYFIARDGYIPKLIADIFIEKWNLDIKTIYIYGSRRAWRMPSYDGKEGTLRRLVGWSYPEKITSVRKFAAMLQVDPVFLLRFLPTVYQDLEAVISKITLERLVWYLDKNSDFRAALYSVQEKARTMVQRYLQQEMDLSDDAFAFVDLGGGGLTQGCVADIMSEFYHRPIQNFFFKMDRIQLMDNCIYYNFLPSKLKNELVIEMICRAPHGQTEGYRMVGNKVIPVLNEVEQADIQAHGYYDYIQGIRAFAQAYAEVISGDAVVKVDLLLFYMDYIMERPDAALLNFFADMPNSFTGRDKKAAAFAPRLTKQNIRDLWLLHVDEPMICYYPGTDPMYAVLRCTPTEKKHIEFYRKFGVLIAKRFQGIMHRPLRMPVMIEEQSLSALQGFDFVLYGAGKYGQRMKRELDAANVSVVQWLDKDYEALLMKGVTVDGTIDYIGRVSYDAVLIAVLDDTLIAQIREVLFSKGIAEECMIYLKDWKHWLDGYLRV